MNLNVVSHGSVLPLERRVRIQGPGIGTQDTPPPTYVPYMNLNVVSNESFLSLKGRGKLGCRNRPPGRPRPTPPYICPIYEPKRSIERICALPRRKRHSQMQEQAPGTPPTLPTYASTYALPERSIELIRALPRRKRADSGAGTG